MSGRRVDGSEMIVRAVNWIIPLTAQELEKLHTGENPLGIKPECILSVYDRLPDEPWEDPWGTDSESSD